MSTRVHSCGRRPQYRLPSPTRDAAGNPSVPNDSGTSESFVIPDAKAVAVSFPRLIACLNREAHICGRRASRLHAAFTESGLPTRAAGDVALTVDVLAAVRELRCETFERSGSRAGFVGPDDTTTTRTGRARAGVNGPGPSAREYPRNARRPSLGPVHPLPQAPAWPARRQTNQVLRMNIG